MLSIKDRLVAAEGEFLSALSNGENALAAFDRRWEILMADADIALEAGQVDPNLPILVHHTATRIATLADISSELYVNYDNITTQLLGEIDILMSQLTLTEGSPGYHRIASSPKSSPEPEEPSRNRRSKRRRDSTGSSLHESTRSQKRSRVVAPSCDDPTETTTQLKTPLSIDHQPSQPPQGASSQLHGLKRKRRSSDADCTTTGGPQKRLYAGPRLHAVSDSYRTFQTVELELYPLSSSPTATQHTGSATDTADSPRDTLDLLSSDTCSEPCLSPCLAPLSRIGSSAEDDWANLTFDFLEPELSSFPPTFDGMDLFLQSLTPGDALSQPPQPPTPASCGHMLIHTSSSVPSLVADSMPSPSSSSSYPSTPSPQPCLDLGPAFLQLEPNPVDVLLDQNLPEIRSMSPSVSKEVHARDARDALLTRPESPTCDSAWSSLFLSAHSMLAFSIPPDPTLSSFTMASETIASNSEDAHLAVSSASVTFGGALQIGSLCPVGAS